MSLPQPTSQKYIIPDANHKHGTKTVDVKTFHAWNLRDSRRWVNKVLANGGPWEAKAKCEKRLVKLQDLGAPAQIIANEQRNIAVYAQWCKSGEIDEARAECMRRSERSRRLNRISGEVGHQEEISEPEPIVDAKAAYEKFQAGLAAKYGWEE